MATTTTKKSPAKKKRLTAEERWAVGELELVMKNDAPLYYHLTSTWYNNYAKKKARGTFDREAALKGLANSFCSQAITFYNKQYGKYGRTIRLSKEAKAEFAKIALRELYECGLKNVRKGSKPKEHTIPDMHRNNIWRYI